MRRAILGAGALNQHPFQMKGPQALLAILGPQGLPFAARPVAAWQRQQILAPGGAEHHAAALLFGQGPGQLFGERLQALLRHPCHGVTQVIQLPAQGHRLPVLGVVFLGQAAAQSVPVLFLRGGGKTQRVQSAPAQVVAGRCVVVRAQLLDGGQHLTAIADHQRAPVTGAAAAQHGHQFQGPLPAGLHQLAGQRRADQRVRLQVRQARRVTAPANPVAAQAGRVRGHLAAALAVQHQMAARGGRRLHQPRRVVDGERAGAGQPLPGLRRVQLRPHRAQQRHHQGQQAHQRQGQMAAPVHRRVAAVFLVHGEAPVVVDHGIVVHPQFQLQPLVLLILNVRAPLVGQLKGEFVAQGGGHGHRLGLFIQPHGDQIQIAGHPVHLARRARAPGPPDQPQGRRRAQQRQGGPDQQPGERITAGGQGQGDERQGPAQTRQQAQATALAGQDFRLGFVPLQQDVHPAPGGLVVLGFLFVVIDDVLEGAPVSLFPLVAGALAAAVPGGAFQQFEVIEAHHHRQFVGEHHLGLIVVAQKVLGVERQNHLHAADDVVPGLIALVLHAVAAVFAAQREHLLAVQTHRLAGPIRAHQKRLQGLPLFRRKAPQGLGLAAQRVQLAGAFPLAG